MTVVYKKTNGNIWDIIPDGGQIPAGFVDVKPPYSLLKPVWSDDEGVWVDDASEQEKQEYYKNKKVELLADFREQMRFIGQEFYNEVDIQVTADLFGQPASVVNPAVEQIDEKIMPIMNLVKDGQWYSAMVLLLKTTPPDNNIARGVWDFVNTKVTEVVNIHYRSVGSQAKRGVVAKMDDVKWRVNVVKQVDSNAKLLSKVDFSKVLKVKGVSKMKKWVHLFFKFVFSILAVSWSVFSAIVALLLSIPIWVLFWYDKDFLPLNFSLYLFSFIGKLGLFPIGFIYAHIIQWLFWEDVRKNLSKYYRDLAVTNDQSGNVYMKYLFNDIFVKENGMLFGDPDETISYVLGYNYVNKSLKAAGWMFSKILSLFDRDHVIKAYQND